jgi:hypothetical protein
MYTDRLYILCNFHRGTKAEYSLNQGPIYWKIPPPQGRYQLMSFGGKNMKRGREKEGKCKRKRKKGVRK